MRENGKRHPARVVALALLLAACLALLCACAQNPDGTSGSGLSGANAETAPTTGANGAGADGTGAAGAAGATGTAGTTGAGANGTGAAGTTGTGAAGFGTGIGGDGATWFGMNVGGGATFADGSYRGAYLHPDEIELSFTLSGGVFQDIRFRALGYRGEDYLETDDAARKAVATQYQQLAEYLTGKGVDALDALYDPASIAKDADTVTAATLRSGKMISAIRDALNRGVYERAK